MTWTRRSFLASAAAAPLFAQKKGAPAPRPNIVLIVSEGLPAWMVGCYGNTEVRTPNLDRLAMAGTRFQHSFVCTPTGSPSKATLLSGRTPRQHGILDFLTSGPTTNPDIGQAAPPAAFANEALLPDLLAAQGYSCGLVGKWALGNDEKPGHGFSFTATNNAGPFTDPTFSVNGSSVPEKGYLPEVCTRYAADFLARQKKESPFFLMLNYLNPHAPYDGHPQKYYDLYKDTRFDSFQTSPAVPSALRGKEYLADTRSNLRKVAASITALDDQIAALQRLLLQKGAFDNTLVIFTSTNGGLFGRHGLWGNGHGSHPINLYEEVVAVPLFWQWPGQVPVQAVRPELVSTYDLVPTLCDALDLKAPGKLCGRSYLKLATNRPFGKKETWRELVFAHFRDTEMARDNYFKLIEREAGRADGELYDVRKDPRERTNLYDNPGYSTVRKALSAKLADWRQTYA